MDALNHVRQRQLRDVVTFFMNDMKNDPQPSKPTGTTDADLDSGIGKVKPQEDRGKTITR